MTEHSPLSSFSFPKLPADRLSQLRHIAVLCGHGEVPFPNNLPAPETQILAEFVRQHRRERLLDLIATRIAETIVSEQEYLFCQDVKTL